MKVSALLSAVTLASIAALTGPAAAQPTDGPPPSYGPSGRPDLTPDQMQQRFVARIMQADANGDGRVTMAEWLRWRWSHPGNHGGDPRREFRRMDLGHQGYLTPDELAAFAAQRGQRGPGFLLR